MGFKSEVNNAMKILNLLFDPNIPDEDSIPRGVVQAARGILLFTCVKMGLGVTVKSGSGLMLYRTKAGTWSAPLSFDIKAVGAGLEAGREKLMCMIILNSDEAVEKFLSGKLTFGADLNLTMGPIGRKMASSRMLSMRGLGQKQIPNYTYTVTRGVFGGVGLQGERIQIDYKQNRKVYGLLSSREKRRKEKKEAMEREKAEILRELDSQELEIVNDDSTENEKSNKKKLEKLKKKELKRKLSERKKQDKEERKQQKKEKKQLEKEKKQNEKDEKQNKEEKDHKPDKPTKREKYDSPEISVQPFSQCIFHKLDSICNPPDEGLHPCTNCYFVNTAKDLRCDRCNAMLVFRSGFLGNTKRNSFKLCTAAY